jgi:hypothetical protein
MPTLILTSPDVASLLDLRIPAVEDAFRQHALGTAIAPASSQNPEASAIDRQRECVTALDGSRLPRLLDHRGGDALACSSP